MLSLFGVVSWRRGLIFQGFFSLPLAVARDVATSPLCCQATPSPSFLHWESACVFSLSSLFCLEGKAKVLQRRSQIEVVGAAIRDKAGRILCALRGEGMPHAGFWEFPGGKIEAHEAPESALIREIREELGCLIEVERLLSHTFDEQSTRRISLRIYLARLSEGEPQAREHERILWLPPPALSELPWMPADREAVAILSGFSESKEKI